MQKCDINSLGGLRTQPALKVKLFAHIIYAAKPISSFKWIEKTICMMLVSGFSNTCCSAGVIKTSCELQDSIWNTKAPASLACLINEHVHASDELLGSCLSKSLTAQNTKSKWIRMVRLFTGIFTDKTMSSASWLSEIKIVFTVCQSACQYLTELAGEIGRRDWHQNVLF